MYGTREAIVCAAHQTAAQIRENQARQSWYDENAPRHSVLYRTGNDYMHLLIGILMNRTPNEFRGGFNWHMQAAEDYWRAPEFWATLEEEGIQIPADAAAWLRS